MILIALVFGLTLRLISLNQSLWIDEATSALTTKMSLANFFGNFMPGDFHPPLYYLTLHTWGAVFGTSEIALRSLSVVFAIGTIYLVYLVGKRAGLIAALLMATSGLHIYYSQEARMYSMSTFLVSLAIYFFTKILHEKSRVGDWVLFSVILGLIGLTDYLPLLILPVFWIFGFLVKKDVYWWKRFIMSHIVIALGAVVWMPLFIKQLTSGINVANGSPAWVSVLGTFSIKDIVLIPVKFMIGRISFDNNIFYAFVVGILVATFGFIFLRSIKLIKSIKNLSLIWLWLIVPIALALVISIKLPVLNYFRFLFVLPAMYILIAFGVNALNKKWKWLFIFVIIIINLATSFVYLTNQKFQREDWRSFVKFVNDQPVLFPADSQKEAFLFYNQKANIIDIKNIQNHKEFWLMRYAQPISDPSDSIRIKVENLGYKKNGEFDFNGVTVWKYTRL